MTSTSHDRALSLVESFLDDVACGRWAAAASVFDNQMRAALGPDGLMLAWQGIVSQVGAYRGRSVAGTSPVGDLVVTETALDFGEERVIARVSVDSDSAVAGFYLLPLSGR